MSNPHCWPQLQHGDLLRILHSIVITKKNTWALNERSSMPHSGAAVSCQFPHLCPRGGWVVGQYIDRCRLHDATRVRISIVSCPAGLALMRKHICALARARLGTRLGFQHVITWLADNHVPEIVNKYGQESIVIL